MLGWQFLDWLLRKAFGKQEGEKVYNSIGVLFGLVILVVSVVTQSWWFAALSGLVVLLSGADLRRERRQRPDPSEDHGLVGEMVSNPQV